MNTIILVLAVIIFIALVVGMVVKIVYEHEEEIEYGEYHRTGYPREEEY